MKYPLDIVTWNLGLLTINLLIKKVDWPTPYVHKRLERVPSALRNIGSDIIVLQEIYGVHTRQSIAKSLRDVYPYMVDPSSNIWWLGVDSGLMIVSKFPIRQYSFIPYKTNLFWESLVTQRGILSAVIDVPGWGLVEIRNTHTVSGGLTRHPETPYIESIRQKQIDQILKVPVLNPSISAIVYAMDLNASPSVSSRNYSSFISAGYSDAYILGSCSECTFDITWDPKNPLNVGGPHATGSRTNSPQRIDHILFCSCDGQIVVQDASIIGKEACVEIIPEKTVTISDHYAVRAILEYTPGV